MKYSLAIFFIFLMTPLLSARAATAREGEKEAAKIEACVVKYSSLQTVTQIISNCVGIVDHECTKENGEQQQTLNGCSNVEAKAWDVVLNNKYKEIMKRLEGKDAERFKDSEKKWIAYRDANCKWSAGNYEGGSMQPLVYNVCNYNETANRIVSMIQNSSQE